jgi:hypothetical protein
MNILRIVAVILLAYRVGFSPLSQRAWVRLFNGKDLDGWTIKGRERWVVDHGTILGESIVGHYGYLTTDKSYKDFVLRVLFKGEGNGNSGVFFHARIKADTKDSGPDIEGMQVEVDPNMGHHTGGLYESAGRGWLIQPTAAGEQALKPGAWNGLEILVHGHHIRTRLNGLQIVDYTDANPRLADGVIALQIHTGGGVRMPWRDLYIQEISP